MLSSHSSITNQCYDDLGKEVAIEMKNDVVITGILLSVDQYLNVKLNLVSVVNKEAHPQLGTMMI